MKRVNEESGQVIIVGLIVSLMIFMTVVSLAQLVQVPLEESMAEKQHFDKVQQELPQIHNSILNSGYSGESSVVRIDMGATYDKGFILGSPFPKLNSIPNQGEITYEKFENRNYTLEGDNITIVTGNRICDNNGTCMKNKNYSIEDSYETGKLTYSMNYNHRSEVVQSFEGIAYYEDIENNKDILLTNQNLMQGNTIYMPLITGNVDLSGINYGTLTISPVSVSQKPIPVKGLEGIYVPTDMQYDIWKEELENNVYVDQVNNDGQDGIYLDLDPDTIYYLSISKIKVTSPGRSVNVKEPQTQYSIISPLQAEVEEDDMVEVTTTSYDKYNNLIKGGRTGEFSSNIDGDWKIGPETTVQVNGRSNGVWKSSGNGTAKFTYTIND